LDPEPPRPPAQWRARGPPRRRGGVLGTAAGREHGPGRNGGGDPLPRLARDPDRPVTTFTSAELRRRAQGARLVVAGAFLVLSGAFFKAQVLDSSEYRSTSESNRVRLVPLPAPRGELRDRNGLLIAENTPGYTIRLWADNVDSLRAVLARVDALTPLDTVDLDKVVARWRAAPYQPAQVFSSGEFRIVSILEEHRAQLP